MKCPKCNAVSGDDWNQCKGACPMPQSPHYVSDFSAVRVADGKYEVRHSNGVGLHALRYGEPWRDLTGDGLVLALVQRIEELEVAERGFASPEALADWLESLHETNDDGAVTGGKWEPAQVAARAIRNMGKQAERSDGAVSDGYFGSVRLKIDGEFVTYILPTSTPSARGCRMGGVLRARCEGARVPEVNIKCETVSNGITGTTALNVIRVEAQDDGSFTAVTDYWPREDARCPPTYRREEAVKALIALGWIWEGNYWMQPAPTEERVRVPEYSAEIEDVMRDAWNGGPQDVYFALRNFFSAAPSQPEDVPTSEILRRKWAAILAAEPPLSAACAPGTANEIDAFLGTRHDSTL